MRDLKRKYKPLERIGLYRILPIHRIPLSLGMKILLVFLLIMALSFVVMLRLSLKLIYDNIWREAQDKLSADLKTARIMYDNGLKEVATVIDFTSNRFFIMEAVEKGDLDELKIQLELIRRDRGLDFMTLTNNDGVVVLRTAPPYATGDNVMSDELVREAMAGKKASGTVVLTKDRLVKESEELVMRAYISMKPTDNAAPGAISEVSSALVMMAAYPVVNQQGKRLGVLYGGKMLNNDQGLVDMIMGALFPGVDKEKINNAMVSIFFWDIRIASTIREPNGVRAVGSRMYKETSESVLNNGLNWFGESWVVFDWYFAAYEPIRDPEGKVIGALGIGLWKAPFITVRNNFIWNNLKIFALGIVIIMLLGLVFSRMLTKPLRELADASAEIAKGNLGHRVSIKPGRDEIRALEIGFNQMAMNLHANMEEKDKLAAALKDLNMRYMELLGFASHELKQPIGVFKLSVANLRKMGPYAQPDKFDAILDRMDRNADYIASMSEKYLFYSEIESGQLHLYERDVNALADIIEPAIEGEQKNLTDKEMRVEILNETKLKSLRLLVDPELMRVVFANLISNAVKYGYQGGYISIGFKETEDSYVFNVKNNGEGIPPDKLTEIFGKFTRLEHVRHKQKGTGLGLFNAKVIVERHGGKIWAESEPGKWADFAFTLPKERVNVSRETIEAVNGMAANGRPG